MTPAVQPRTVESRTVESTAPATRRSQGTGRKYDRPFFAIMVLLCLGTVLWGFARTYFLAGMIAAPLPNRLVHIHGAAFTLWMVLLVVQTALITARQIKVHQTLGIAGFLLAIAMVVLGTLASIDALQRGSGPLGLTPLTFFIVPLSEMVLFAVLIAAAFRARRRPEAHKRLILIATIALLTAATGRIPIPLFVAHPPLQILVPFIYILFIALYDVVSLRRISATTAWAGGLLLVLHAVRVPLAMLPPWQHFAAWVRIHG